MTASRRLVAAAVALAVLAVGCASAPTRPGDAAHDAGARDGGKLVFGLAAEPTVLDPTAVRFTQSTLQVSKAVFETLAEYDAAGAPVPSLAEAITPNDDFTKWDITLRPGVRFHDGETLDAAALRKQFEAVMASPLMAPAVSLFDSFRVVDSLVLRIRLKAPLTMLPHLLTTQVGVVMAPASLDDPARGDHPVGTGPFSFDSWTRGERLVVKRFPGYWREGLPHLDEIEFRPIVEGESRGDALLSGDVNVATMTEADEIARFEDLAGSGQYQVLENPAGETDEELVQLDTASPPFDDPAARRALALATDSQRLVDEAYGGRFAVASGPFREGSPWHRATDGPSYDPVAASQAVAEVESRRGPLEFTILTAGGIAAQQSAQYLAGMWAEAGIDAHVASLSDEELSAAVSTGAYQAVLWAQFGANHPVIDAVSWDGASVPPTPWPALNSSRLRDDELSAAIARLRTDVDQASAVDDVAVIQARLALDLPYLWLFHTRRVVVAASAVHDLAAATTPDGTPTLFLDNGVHAVGQIWLSP